MNFKEKNGPKLQIATKFTVETHKVEMTREFNFLQDPKTLMSTHISISEGVEGDVHDILELEVGGVELVYEVCPAVGAQRLVVEVNLDWRSSVLGKGLKKN